MCQLIDGLALPSLVVGKDVVCWWSSSDVDFLVASTYFSLARHDQQPSNPLFPLIRRWKGVGRVKTFLWLLAYNSLLTNTQQFHRHVSDDPQCSRCNSMIHEYALHALRDYLAIGDFLFWLVSLQSLASFFTSNICKWLLGNLRGGHSSSGLEWSHYFAKALHFLWHARNKEIFERLALFLDESFVQFQLHFQRNLFISTMSHSTIVPSSH